MSTQAPSSAPTSGEASLAWGDRLRRQVLFPFGDERAEKWTIGDALEGAQIFGATGSGKTTGSGATIAQAFLNAGFGGLVLTAKPDELETWCRYFSGTNRDLSEITVIEPAGKFPAGRVWPREFTGKVRTATSFNLLEYEYREGGELTQNLVTLFLNAMSSGGPSVSRQDPYWDEALREHLTHAIDLLVLAGREVNLPDLVDLVRSAPQTVEEAKSRSWWNGDGCCRRLITAANEWSKTDEAHGPEQPRRRDLEQTLRYWLADFPRLNDRTRSIIVSSFTAKAAGLLRSPLRELFCGRTDAEHETDANPEQSHRGRVLILHLPVKLYGEVGRFAQVLYKTTWQRATERRLKVINQSADWPPVFLWADEAQYFLTPEDMQYQMTARSVFAATVYLTQNISSYYAMMGGNDPRAAVDSFLGNLQTKIFHANGDSVTNQWAERLFAEKPLDIIQRQLTGGGGSSSPSPAPLVPAVLFTELKKGGQELDWQVEAYIFQAGRTWVADVKQLRHKCFLHKFVQMSRKPS